MMPNFSGDDGG
jgi:hypothetical protein